MFLSCPSLLAFEMTTILRDLKENIIDPLLYLNALLSALATFVTIVEGVSEYQGIALVWFLLSILIAEKIREAVWDIIKGIFEAILDAIKRLIPS